MARGWIELAWQPQPAAAHRPIDVALDCARQARDGRQPACKVSNPSGASVVLVEQTVDYGALWAASGSVDTRVLDARSLGLDASKAPPM